MALKHSVYDTDAHFKIDPITRTIKNESPSKTVLIQYDHNSERFTFELPRMIDGHDMSKCDVVQVHYINIDSKDKHNVSKDAHDLDDLQISPDSEDVVICSWLIDGNATKYAGSLNFLIKFKCIGDDGNPCYVWNTATFTNISVSSGIDNGEFITAEYSDILEQWRQNLLSGDGNTSGSGGNVDLTGVVKSVNGQIPDANGNVALDMIDFVSHEDLLDALEDYATEEFVTNKIAEAELGGKEVDLSGYAQKSEIPTKVSQLQNDKGYLTEHQSLTEYAKKTDIPTVPTKVSQLQNDKGYLTEHQDISDLLPRAELPEAVNDALAQAKTSGEFDGPDGQRGTGILKVTTTPTSYTTTTAGVAPIKRMSLSTIKSEAKVDEVLVGDQIFNSYYLYRIYYTDATYAYMDKSQSIRGSSGSAGANGEDGVDGVSPTVAVSKSGKVTTISITDKNGTKTATINDGADGADGEDLSAYTVPDYWQTAIDSVVSKVRALQDAGGRDTVNFLYFSDLHYGDNIAKVAHVGHLCAAIMDKCNIPLVINCGDTMSSSPLSSESALLTNLDNGTALLSPIPMDGYAQIFGNHDDVWGQYKNGDTTVSYVNKVAPSKMWSRVFRKQTTDLRRVFGGNGTYFYIDNVPQKVRFVCLNSHYYDGAEITNGTTKIMTTGFGAEQLEWLENTALDVENGWSVVIATHVPPTAKTINNVTYYLSQISDGAAFRTVIQNTTAHLIGIFCGHCHASAIVTNDLPCPIVTITTAGGSPYDSNEGTRTAGTTTETAIDVVSINKAEEKIYLTRIGIGSDRVCSYAGAEIVTHSITNTLTNVTNSNSTSVIESGKSYTANLTVNSDYENLTVTVKMGGTDITATAYSNGVVNIASVTGDVVITASATKAEVKPSYDNLADPTSADWVNNSRLGSDGKPKAEGSLTGGAVTNWIDCVYPDIIRIKGLNIMDTTAGYAQVYTTQAGSAAKPSSYSAQFVTDDNGVITFTAASWISPSAQSTVTKLRFSGMLTGTAADVIITKNQEIT